LDHTPENPGLPEEEYRKAFKGTSTSNLAIGVRSLERAVDVWMDDSDRRNIDRIGHRRWCLNPTMRIVGFGRADRFTAMTCQARSRRPVPDFDFVCWPARGPMPVEYFKPTHAWSVSLNPMKYRAPDAVKPKLYALDRDGNKTGDPLPLDYTGVDKQ